MDGQLIHVSGRCQYLFPSDGGHITVDNVSYVEGKSASKAQHVFVVLCNWESQSL